MAKKYKRSKTVNKFALATANLFTNKTLMRTSFTKTLIVRGIGYRAFVLSNSFLRQRSSQTSELLSMRPLYTEVEQNDLQSINQVGVLEFTGAKYVVIRAGHTRDLCIPLQVNLRGITSKKDRKLVIASKNNSEAANLAKYVYAYRPPSVYTGRGVRVKHAKPVRKAGKKDKQKGRAF
jgi:ribosomal protein L6P/L9E